MRSILWLGFFVIAACSSRPQIVRSQIAIDKWSILNQTFEEKDARKQRLRSAFRKLKKRENSTPSRLPIVKLRPTIPRGAEETETVADSADEWMHHYYRGLSLVAENEYELAVTEFKRFIYVEPGHVYADRAQYWIAESYYRAKEYEMCVLAANGFLLRFPYSIKVADMLYRRALALSSLGQSAAAIASLKDLLRRHPSSQLAESAAVHLSRWQGSEVTG